MIVEATLSLVPAPTTVRLYDLFNPDLDALLAEMFALIDDERFDTGLGLGVGQAD